MTERHRAIEFKRCLNLINRSVPDDLDVHLVVDSVSIHKTPDGAVSPEIPSARAGA